MAIEYTLYLECPLQDNVQYRDFMSRARVRHVLTTIDEQNQQVKDAGDNPDELEVKLPSYAAKKTGLNETLTVKELRRHCLEYDKEGMKYCHQCPGNVWQEIMGCHGAIELPISANAENWLMNQFQPPEGDKSFTAHHLVANKLLGRKVDATRPQENGKLKDGVSVPIFELPYPVATKLSDDGPLYTSSQIIEFLSGCEPTIIPQTLFGLCRDFGFISGDTEEVKKIYGFLAMEAMSGPEEMVKQHGPEWKQHITQNLHFTMSPEEDEDPSINQWRAFFYAAWQAFTQDTILFVHSPSNEPSAGC